MLYVQNYSIIPLETSVGNIPILDLNKNGVADPNEPVVKVFDIGPPLDDWCGTRIPHVGHYRDYTHIILADEELKEKLSLEFPGGNMKSLSETFDTSSTYVCGGRLLLCTVLGVGNLTIHSGLTSGLEQVVIQ